MVAHSWCRLTGQFLFVTHQFDWNATSLSSCLLLTVLCLLQCSQQFLCLSHRTLSANALCLGCLSSHSSVRPFVYLLICQFPTDDLIRFWRWKVKDTAGWSIWWQRHPHRCWGIKVHLPVFVYFWPTYTVEGQTSNGRWRLSSSVVVCTTRICSIAHQGAACGGQVVLCPVRETPCLYSSPIEILPRWNRNRTLIPIFVSFMSFRENERLPPTQRQVAFVLLQFTAV